MNENTPGTEVSSGSKLDLPLSRDVTGEVTGEVSALHETAEQPPVDKSEFDQSKSQVQIKVEHGPAISFSQALNNVQFLQSISIVPNSGIPLTNIDIQLSVVSLGHKLNQPWNRLIKLLTPETGKIKQNELRLEFDPVELIEIEQLQQGELIVQAFSDGELIGETKSKVKVLPANAWTYSLPLRETAASLAAFVNPFDAAIDELITEATPRLRAMGVDGWPGYQSGPEVVDKMAQALYETLCARDIKYINPPPTWEIQLNDDLDSGQRIRTATEVINGRFGTCLDTSVTFAALLEKIGLNPFLVLMPGHAQVGYWRVSNSFPDHISEIRQMQAIADISIKEGGRLISLVESTAYANSSPPPFSQLHQMALERIHELGVFTPDPNAQKASENRSAVIDIQLTRGVGGVSILPTKRVRSDGQVEIVSPALLALTLNDVRSKLDGIEGGTRSSLGEDNFPPRVKRWRNSLLDLSLNNPLIRMRDTTLRVAVPLGALGTIEDLIQSGQQLEIIPTKDPTGDKIFANRGIVTDAESIDFLTNLLGQSSALLVQIPKSTNFFNSMRRLVSAHKNSIEESGHNDLFLALGSLDWSSQSESKYEKVQAPLFLVPITIKSYNKSRNFRITIDPTSSTVPNYSLLEMLDTKFNFKLPKLMNPDLDDFGIDIDGSINYVRKRILEEKLDFLVDESAHIGTFDFSTYRLWRDITDNWKKFEEQPLVKHLIHNPSDEYLGNDGIGLDDQVDLDELSSELPIAVDGTQARAIHDALSGKSLLIQGPPGTGKSQTISNLLIKAIHDGKRVLFVAEKSVAVDVVAQRLSSIGLDDFFLDLHNKSARPAAVRDQLQRSLSRTVFPDLNGLEVARRAQAQAVIPLKNFPTQLHARGKFNESAYSSNDILMSIAEGPSLTVTPAFLSTISKDRLDSFVTKLDEVPDTGKNSGNAKRNRWSYSTLTNDQFTNDKRDKIREIVRAYEKQASVLLGSNILDLCQSLSVSQFLSLGKSLQTTPPAISAVELHNSATAKDSFTKLLTYIDQLKESSASNPHSGPAILDMPLESLTNKLTDAQESFVIGRSKKVNQVLAQFNSYFSAPVADALKLGTSVIPHLAQIIEFAQFVKTTALSQPGLTIPITWNPLKSEDISLLVNQKAQLDSWAQVLIGDSTSVLAMRKFVQEVDATTSQQLTALTDSLEQLFELTGATQDSILLWSGSKSVGEHLIEDATYWLEDERDIEFANLNRWVLLYSLVHPLVAHGAKTAAFEILNEQVPFHESSNSFRRGYLSVLRLRQIREQGLETFDGPNHDRSINEFNRSIADIRKFLPEQYADQLIQARGFDATESTGAVGELARELNKTKGQKSVRALISTHWKVLTRITPCILASPSSVALFLDPDLEPFDLVIFDEASQIKVPHAIGALGRAKAAVIVGDSKQMPPSAPPGMLAKQVDTDEDDDGFVAVPDEESILSECYTAGLPQSWLSWHYRSQDESLIAFSNKNYYDGKLSSFPSPSKNRGNKGVSFVATKGHFYRKEDSNKTDPSTNKPAEIGTNPIEARAIVAEITRRLNDAVESKFSLLVVTLNEKQAGLIINLLSDSPDIRVQQALISDSEEPLMVKALEQVQGSERDVVLMSIGFSRNEKGILHARFGPLNQANGHRRLNVAVTRARRQVLVYCSFEPSELANKSQAKGINDLQAYLAIAQSGDDALVNHSNPSDVIDRHRENIVKRLIARGFNVESLVGTSDFKVDIAILDPDNPEDRILGILLDNGPWQRRKTVIDRDTLPPEVLKNKMAWPAVERIWLPMWLKDSDGEVTRIELAAKSAIIKKANQKEEIPEPLPPISAQIDESPIAPVNVVSPSATTQASPPTSMSSPMPTSDAGFWTPWEVQIVGGQWQIDSLPGTRSVQAVQDVMQEIVAAEAPIEPMRAARLVGQAYGLSAMRERRAAEILAVSIPGTVRDEEGFIYLKDQDPFNGWSKWRVHREDATRKIDEISLHEISNAMKYLAIKGLGISEEELIKETAIIFGFKRLSDAIKFRMLLAIELAEQKGTLRKEGKYLTAIT